MTDEQKTEAAWLRYREAAEAMQAGVNAEMSLGQGGVSPKHLRVGVNSALVQSSALLKFLVKKGLATDLEIAELMADSMTEEVRSYEQRLTTMTGRPVALKPGAAVFEDTPPADEKH